MKFTIKHMADNGQPSGAAQSSAQQNVQNQVAQVKLGPETRRKLAIANYASNTNVVVDIPRDTSVKRLHLSWVFGATVTYASGSPTISPFGLASRICPNFYIVADGSRNIKVLDLFMQRCQNALARSSFPRRAYKTGASLTGTSSWPTTEHLSGTVAYPATTQDIIYNESIMVEFENPYAFELGSNISQLYTRNLQTCTMTFGFGDVSSLQTTGVGASVTYSNVSCAVTPTIIEDRAATLANGAYDYNEFVIRKSYSSQQNLAQIDLNAGNKITGISLMAQNGDSGLSLSDIVLTDMQLLTNGVNPIHVTSFRDAQNYNKARNGDADDQFASGLHALSGYAFLNLLKSGNALSGLDTALSDGVSTVQLQVSTGPSSGKDAVTYTNPVTISVLQQQLVPVPVKS